MRERIKLFVQLYVIIGIIIVMTIMPSFAEAYSSSGGDYSRPIGNDQQQEEPMQEQHEEQQLQHHQRHHHHHQQHQNGPHHASSSLPQYAGSGGGGFVNQTTIYNKMLQTDLNRDPSSDSDVRVVVGINAPPVPFQFIENFDDKLSPGDGKEPNESIGKETNRENRIRRNFHRHTGTDTAKRNSAGESVVVDPTIIGQQFFTNQQNFYTPNDEQDDENDDDEEPATVNSSNSDEPMISQQDDETEEGFAASKIVKNFNTRFIASGGVSSTLMDPPRSSPSISSPIVSTGPSCHSCQSLEMVKAENLASIKRHILMRLEMKTFPNIIAPIIPKDILEKFYKNHPKISGSSGGVDGAAGVRKHSTISDGFGGDYNMQGDDPSTYHSTNKHLKDGQIVIAENDKQNGDESDEDDRDDDDIEDDGNLDEEFFSIVNSAYIFPSDVQRVRHNRKAEILHFAVTNNGHSTVSSAVLNVYIRGNDLRTVTRDGASTSTMEGGGSSVDDEITTKDHRHVNAAGDGKHIVISVHRVLRPRQQQQPGKSQSSSSSVPLNTTTHIQKVDEIRQPIVNGSGTWISINVTDMVASWYNNPSANYGLVIKVAEQWMKAYVVTDETSTNNKQYALYIEVLTKDNRKRRTKRDASLNCSESDNEERCCRYPLEVDFRTFNWDWIIAPSSFNAYFCNGECKLGFLPKYPHTHIMQLSTAPQPCCSPTKMSPITLLYFNNEHTLVMSTIPNMSVDRCSCS